MVIKKSEIRAIVGTLLLVSAVLGVCITAFLFVMSPLDVQIVTKASCVFAANGATVRLYELGGLAPRGAWYVTYQAPSDGPEHVIFEAHEDPTLTGVQCVSDQLGIDALAEGTRTYSLVRIQNELIATPVYFRDGADETGNKSAWNWSPSVSMVEQGIIVAGISLASLAGGVILLTRGGRSAKIVMREREGNVSSERPAPARGSVQQRE